MGVSLKTARVRIFFWRTSAKVWSNLKWSQFTSSILTTSYPILVFLTFCKEIIKSNIADRRWRLVKNNDVISTFYDVLSQCSSLQGKYFWKCYNRVSKFHCHNFNAFLIKGGGLQILLSFTRSPKSKHINSWMYSSRISNKLMGISTD